MYKILTLITNSFLFLTCSTIIEGLKFVINTKITKIDPKSTLILYTAIPIICITITISLIIFTDTINDRKPT